MNKRNQIASVECLLWLMMNPECTEKQFCDKWEKTRTTFYRMKRYIRDRLFMYEVK